jgi:hypothetical protein
MPRRSEDRGTGGIALYTRGIETEIPEEIQEDVDRIDV